MSTDSELRQTAIDVLHKELKSRRLSRARCETALAVLTEMREATEDREEPKRQLQDFVQEELLRTAVQIELERKLSLGKED